MPSTGNAWIDLRNQTKNNPLIAQQWAIDGENARWYYTQTTATDPQRFVDFGAWEFMRAGSDVDYPPPYIQISGVDPKTGNIGPQYPYWISAGFDAAGNIDPALCAAHPIIPNQSLFASFFTTLQSSVQGLGPVFTIASMIILPGLAEEIGAAVFGDAFSIAYPEIATGLGDVALTTAFNGGNISASLKKTIASQLGGTVGDVAGTGMDSATVGKLAQVATSAAVNGQDIRGAVQSAITGGLVGSAITGVGKMDFSIDDTSVTGYSDAQGNPVDVNGNLVDTSTAVNSSTDSAGNVTTQLPDGTIIIDHVNGDTTTINADGTGTVQTAGGSVTSYDPNGNLIPTIDPETGNTVDAATGEVINWTSDQYLAGAYLDTDGNLRGPDNDLIMTAAEISDAYDQGGNAGVVAAAIKGAVPGMKNTAPAAPGRNPATPTPAAQSNTPIINQAAAAAQWGAVAQQWVNVAKTLTGQGGATPVAGSTVTLSNGARVTNNGNGTQTTVFLNGHRVTTPLGQAAVDTVATPMNTGTVPGVGQTITLANGSRITNNGNGTLTTVTASGSTTTAPIASGLSSQTMLILGAGLLAFAAMSKRGSRGAYHR